MLERVSGSPGFPAKYVSVFVFYLPCFIKERRNTTADGISVIIMFSILMEFQSKYYL